MYNSYGTFYHNGYSELYHHGVKGQKHGTRRWQNPDGSLTPAGYEHYGYGKRRINKQTGKSEFVINKRQVASRNKYVQRQIAVQDKRAAKGKKATTPEYIARVWDATNSPAAKKEGRKAMAKFMAVGIPASSVAASIATGTAMIAIPGLLPIGIAAGAFTSRQVKKATEGVQQYRTQNTHTATSKKDTGSKKYDLTFLEYYDQDDKPKTTKQLDHEYEKYKKDPEKWLENLSKQA